MAGETFEKKNILVAGGAGFIGSHLCDELVKKNKVICVDDFTTGDRSNIEHLLKLTDFIFIKHDLNKPIDFEAFPELERFKVKFQGIQEIYNMAAPTSPKQFEEKRIHTLDANSLTMKTLLELAVKYKSKFLQGSSSVIYGPRPDDNQLFTEDLYGSVNLLSPRACYDEGKRFAETMTVTYQQVYGLDAKIARIFRTYGPRMRLFDGQMIPDFITDALDNKDLVIYGDENFDTSLIYVSDVVDGLVRLMAAPAEIGPVNLGGDQVIKLVDVANKIIQMTESTAKVLYEEPLPFMTPLGLPSIIKAKDKLNWIPVVTLETGFQKSIEYAMATKGLLRA